METKINGNDLIHLGYSEGNLIGIALKINNKRNGFTKVQMLENFKNVLAMPETYIEDKIFI